MAFDQKAYAAEWYQRNRETVIQRTREYRKANLEVVRERENQYGKDHPETKAKNRKSQYEKRNDFLKTYKLESGCVDCGYNENHAGLEFDHVRGEKRFNISGKKCIKMADLLEELAKCEVRCGTCHNIATYNRRKA